MVRQVCQDELGCSNGAGCMRGEYAQGYGLGRYDLVFATNALHTACNVGKALQRCKTLLRKGGLLVASELSTKTPFLSLTFGLTAAWWLHDDESRRITGRPASAVRNTSLLHTLRCIRL